MNISGFEIAMFGGHIICRAKNCYYARRPKSCEDLGIVLLELAAHRLECKAIVAPKKNVPRIVTLAVTWPNGVPPTKKESKPSPHQVPHPFIPGRSKQGQYCLVCRPWLALRDDPIHTRG